MAVVQISRIQVRRGKSLSGTGLPQLASGELAWSLDTQELYIGNGSVAEGSPAVGNTKILTERDLTVQGNLLNLLQHIYKADDPAIQTGPTSNSPISRRVQDRLDDHVSVADFGAVGNGTTDDSAAIQRAVDQLFLNPSAKASADTATGVDARVVLEFNPGIYKITSTIFIPSYATLVGAGLDKTILSYTGSGPAIQFVNDSSTIGNPSTIGSTLGNTQPRNITLRGLTVLTNTSNQIGLKMDAVRDSVFEDLVIKGVWNGTYNANSKGIDMNAVSALVTCSNNIFNNIVIRGFSYAVWAKQDVINNVFSNFLVTDVRQGFVLGEGANGTTVGEQYGPRETQMIRGKFDDVKQHAIIVGRGSGNNSRDNKFTNVGNNGAGVFFPAYPHIYFATVGNTSQNDQSDREDALSSLSFTVNMDLSDAITKLKNATVVQATTGVTGALKQDYTSAAAVTVVTKYLTPFNTTNTLIIAGDTTPGNAITLTVTGSDTVKYATADTSKLSIGTAISFGGTMGGVTSGTTYYVQNIPDSTHFSIADSLGGAQRALTVSSGSMLGTYEPTIKPTLVSTPTMVPYLPEVAGYGTYKSYGTKHAQLGYVTSPSLAFTLPISTSPSGSPVRSISYEIDYMYRSSTNGFTRRGQINLVVDIDATVATYSTKAQLSDEYNVTGITEADALLLDFSAVLLNENGAPYGGVGEIPSAIAIRYTNTYSPSGNSDSGTLAYSYTVTL